jgi:hypothetical protein
MHLEEFEDVSAIGEFMQKSVAASTLASTTKPLSLFVPILWGNLSLRPLPSSGSNHRSMCVVLSIHSKTPNNWPLILCMLMVILWGQRPRFLADNFPPTSFAAIDARMIGRRSGFIFLIERGVVAFANIRIALVESHSRSPSVVATSH